MTDEVPQGFQRNMNAVVDAFKAGLAFDPPVISPTEYRKSLRFIGLPLDQSDDLDRPHFEFPDPTDVESDEDDDEFPEEDD